MKVSYTKESEFKLFGFKIFTLKTRYIENSKEGDEDNYNMDFVERTLQAS